MYKSIIIFFNFIKNILYDNEFEEYSFYFQKQKKPQII